MVLVIIIMQANNLNNLSQDQGHIQDLEHWFRMKQMDIKEDHIDL